MWASSVLKLYRRFFGSPTGSENLQSGVETVLDGNTAVAVTEACIAEAAGLGGSFPADGAARTWELERLREGTNFFGRSLTSNDAGEARGALASAIGMSAAGLRATAFVSGPDLIYSQDLLRLAVGRHLPLVLHVGARSPVGHAAARGSGHEAYHAVADAGCFQLFARNVQQAVDFTLVARRVAELGLIPGLVAMDSEQTALGAQDVHLPPPELVRELIGSPEDTIATPSEAQKLLFGSKRRRVPVLHSLDHPVLSGGFQGPEAWALGAAGQGPYFAGHLADFLELALADLEKRTGRAQPLVSSHETDGAPLLLVAQGSAIETAEAMADWLRKERKQKIGVIGIHCLRPFPAARVLELIRGKTKVGILERVDAPFSSDAPLLREIRSVVERALENARYGSETHPGLPSWREDDRPRFHSVLYGLGGQPVRGADLSLLASELESKGRSQVYLGIEFAPDSSTYPKREVLLDQLRRSYPQVVDLALRSKEATPDIRPEKSLTIGVHHISGDGAEGLAAEAAALLHRLAGGHIRSRPCASWGRFAEHDVDRFTHSVNDLGDPGDDVIDDIAILANGEGIENLRKGGTVVVVGEESVTGLATEAEVFAVPAATDETERKEHLLGGLAGVLATQFGWKPKTCTSARAEMLEHLPEDERQSRLSAFEAGLTGLRSIPVASEPPRRPAGEHEVPMAVRVLGQADGTLDSLPRFWDQVGVLYKNGDARELSADPYLATGAVPPLTSTFRDLSEARVNLPVFDPSLCTGCGACWTWCPEGAVAPLAVGPTALLEAGMGLAKADALRPVISQLASRVSTEIKTADPAPAQIGETLDKAFEWLKEKMPMPDERKKAVQEAFDAVTKRIGTLPAAKTAPFFDEAETRAKGTGEILSIAINPDACKDCGICVSVCEPEALVEKPQDAVLVEEARRGWRLWEQLPDTGGETIDRVREHTEVGPAAAMLLSRSCLLAMAGGDGAEAGSGEKVALRLMLGAAEYHQQPRVRRLAVELEETRAKLAARIRETLADALPTSDLDALAEGLDLLGGATANLPALMERVHGAVEKGRVDAKRLRREVETAQQLADAKERLTRAAGGMGRSRVGLAVAADSSTSWAGTFPDNPFSAPAFVDLSGEAAGLAMGLLEGQLVAAMDAFVALRRAKLELDNPEEAERESAAVRELTWHELSDAEREACPPLVLVGSTDALARHGLASLLELLRADMPIKVLAFANTNLSLDDKPRDPSYDLAFAALGLRKPFVAQTSIADPTHFYESARAAFAHLGPALLHVHTPSPNRHGFGKDSTIEQARLATASRVFPLFRYEPTGEGVFGLHLSLEGNPEPESVYMNDEAGEPLTPAHWAVSEKRFDRSITLMADGSPGPTPLKDYMGLPADQRDGKTPFITVGEEGRRWAVSRELAIACEERVAIWRRLQEVAGIVTPFTERVREEAARTVAEAHQADLQSLRNEYEAKIKDLGASKESEIAQKIKNQLLALTGYKK